MTPESIREYVRRNQGINDIDRAMFLGAADEIERLRSELDIEREAHASALARNRQLRDELEGSDDA